MKKRMVYKALSKLLKNAPVLKISDKDKIVIFSDLHMGGGGYRDDFSINSEMFAYILKNYYLCNKFKLILNGDIEELFIYSLNRVLKSWPDIYKLFNEFKKKKRLYKIVGNHDYKLLFKKPGFFDIPYQSLRLIYNNNTILVFHGHEADSFLRQYNWFVPLILHYIAYPLYIKNNEVSFRNSKKYKVEKKVYEFSTNKKIISIIGHTHRPLFESLSKIDALRFRIEQLCRIYPDSGRKEKIFIASLIKKFKHELIHYYDRKNIKEASRSSLYDLNLHVPCLFNSGCVIGKSGITAIEIEDGSIGLVHWFDKNRRKKYLKFDEPYPERLGKSSYYKVIFNQELLSYVFTRIKLLA